MSDKVIRLPQVSEITDDTAIFADKVVRITRLRNRKQVLRVATHVLHQLVVACQRGAKVVVFEDGRPPEKLVLNLDPDDPENK
jgi:hypothetical protein